MVSHQHQWLARRGARPATKYGLRRMKFLPRRANLDVVSSGWMDDRPIAALAKVVPAA